MVTEPRTLESLLEDCGREAGGLLRVPSGKAFRALSAALAQDAVLAARAATLLDSIDPQVAMRDQVSRWRKMLLERALPGGSA